ncbi:GMC oxidoreductase [Nocardia brasiliensis]|uniref:GMC oxidoreductase n=1 Tax=Nocardia brasiliensis TaxID=37326 RepID=UPI0002F7C49D
MTTACVGGGSIVYAGATVAPVRRYFEKIFLRQFVGDSPSEMITVVADHRAEMLGEIGQSAARPRPQQQTGRPERPGGDEKVRAVLDGARRRADAGVRLGQPASFAVGGVARARAVGAETCGPSRVGGAPFVPEISLTAHPLGGVPIGRATDLDGRVIGCPNLYVVDGALIPGNCAAANPSLTIAGLAERALDRVLPDVVA